jgi:uncharacterized alkaline shock family protein YloU
MPAAVAPLPVARLAERAALDTPGVSSLHAGAVGELATWGGGDRVGGVSVRTGREPSVTVAVVAHFGVALGNLADEVRHRVVAALVGEHPEAAAWPVHVHVADIVAPDAAQLSRST